VIAVDGISNGYINNAIDELTAQLGVKEPIAVRTILEPLRAGNIQGCTESIAQYLGLPVAVNLSHAPFESTGLVNTDGAGRGVAGITAQVSIPGYLPFYGTPGLEKFPIFVRISDNCLRYPVTFATIMAHELSHIVLHSLQHKERDNEFYADLTAMILGFSRVMKDGRKTRETQTVQTQNYIIYSQTITQTTTMTYGYLSDSHFKLAFDKIERILRKYKASCHDSREELARKLSDYEKKIVVYKQQLSKFSKFVDYVDRKHTTRMSQEDTARLIAVHQPGYVDRFAAVLRSNEEKRRQIRDRLPVGLSKGTASHYTTRTTDSLRALCNDVGALLSNLEQEYILLKNDVGVLKKHVGVLVRF
jgi:uncharacterized protein YeeX (DUF496 family)